MPENANKNKDEIIKRQNEEIQKLKKDLRDATKPKRMLYVLKNAIKMNIEDIFDREGKMKKMQSKIDELEKELQHKDAELYAATYNSKEDSQDSEDETAETTKEPEPEQDSSLPKSMKEFKAFDLSSIFGKTKKETKTESQAKGADESSKAAETDAASTEKTVNAEEATTPKTTKTAKMEEAALSAAKSAETEEAPATETAKSAPAEATTAPKTTKTAQAAETASTTTNTAKTKKPLETPHPRTANTAKTPESAAPKATDTKQTPEAAAAPKTAKTIDKKPEKTAAPSTAKPVKDAETASTSTAKQSKVTEATAPSAAKPGKPAELKKKKKGNTEESGKKVMTDTKPQPERAAEGVKADEEKTQPEYTEGETSTSSANAKASEPLEGILFPDLDFGDIGIMPEPDFGTDAHPVLDEEPDSSLLQQEVYPDDVMGGDWDDGDVM